MSMERVYCYRCRGTGRIPKDEEDGFCGCCDQKIKGQKTGEVCRDCKGKGSKLEPNFGRQ